MTKTWLADCRSFCLRSLRQNFLYPFCRCYYSVLGCRFSPSQFRQRRPQFVCGCPTIEEMRADKMILRPATIHTVHSPSPPFRPLRKQDADISPTTRSAYPINNSTAELVPISPSPSLRPASCQGVCAPFDGCPPNGPALHLLAQFDLNSQ